MNSNMTFVIGNGFDLSLGLQTSYSAFYPCYIASTKNMLSTYIEKDLVANNIDRKHTKWSDFESAMGRSFGSIRREQLKNYLEDIRDFSVKFADYLRTEQDKIDKPDPQWILEFVRGIEGFQDKLPRETQGQFNKWMSSRNTPISYNFITFNYTDLLDKIVKYTKRASNRSNLLQHSFVEPMPMENRKELLIKDNIVEPMHVHGTLDSGILIGVDNIHQIHNLNLSMHSEELAQIIKPEQNRLSRQMRMEGAQQIIDESQYIVVFGASIGETDKTWWRKIAQWLVDSRNPLKRLIIFAYTEFPHPTEPMKVNLTNEIIRNFLQNSGYASHKKYLEERIIVICGQLFDFKAITR